MYTQHFGTHPGKKSSKYLNNTAVVKNCLASDSDCPLGGGADASRASEGEDTQVQLQINKHRPPSLGVQAAWVIRNRRQT